MKLSELLDSQLIFTELESLEKELFLRKIISRISDVQSSIKESTVIDLILKREKLCSTGLDNFIAIPHAKIPGIDKTYISLCISNNGIDFGSIDGLKTKILILILNPEETGNHHLEILKSVSSLFTKKNVINQMLNIKNPEDIINFIKDNE
jgi:mannitol/fructose-specific phosphotransferase system IIA component (Ntr-type)